ncbi:MAG: hypothetical protein ACQERZ_06990 [Fusobacteriota bacterium]
MKKIVILILAINISLIGETFTDISFGIGREYYNWKEFINGELLLEENGPL